MSPDLPKLLLALLVPLAAGAAAAPRTFATVEEFAREIAMKPGGWHTRFTLTSIEVELPPGVDPALREKAKAAMPLKVGSVQEMHECAGPTAQGPSLPGILLNRGCTYSKMEAGGGRWAVAYFCPKMGRDGAGSAAASGRGTYAAERVTGSHESDLELKGLVVHVKGEVVSRFTGQCRPSAPPVAVEVVPPRK